MYQESVVLIGMPGAGKSTIGILLAKELGLDFVDTDVLIQVAQRVSLQEILEQRGYLELRRIEEEVILGLQMSSVVIATGGSAVYGNAGMQHLKDRAQIVFIDVPLDVLRARITNYETRGVARRADQSFEDLFEERCELYRKFADVEILGADLTPAALVAEIMQKLRT